MLKRSVRAILVVLVCLAGLAFAKHATSRSNEPDGGFDSLARSDRTVFLVGDLGYTDRIFFTTNVLASRHPGVVLYDSPKARPFLNDYLRAFRPDHVVPIGKFSNIALAMDEPLEIRVGKPFDESGLDLFAQAETVVICPSQPYDQLLQAACLSGFLHAPLVRASSDDAGRTRLTARLKSWQPKRLYLIGSAAEPTPRSGSTRIHHLRGAEEISNVLLGYFAKHAPIRTLVVANPTDKVSGSGALSSLSPIVALQHRGFLLFTNAAGDDCERVVAEARKQPPLSRADNLILVGDLKAIPTKRRPNPIAGKDAAIEMEPLTPDSSEPFTFATGRMFHEDPAVVLLMLARERLLAQDARGLNSGQGSRRALVVSNPGGGLPLLETLSRTTAQEFRECGYETTALFDERVNRQAVRSLLPSQDIFLWEGHYRTLVDAYEMPTWTEPLRPALIFLQSCLALNEREVQPLFQRGAIGVIGSSTRTYSGTGGSFTLAFFDALLYEHLSLGASLRQAKNFLLAYTLLKEKRLGQKAKLAGANLRSAWAFTLWGDPELQLPRPKSSVETPHVVPHVRGNSIIFSIPQAAHSKVSNNQYEAEIWPNGRLAGLVYKELDEDERKLVPLLFAEVPLRHGPAGAVPRLTSRLPESRWAFCWDRHRSIGYVLALPRAQDKDEIRFHVTWVSD